MSRRWFRLWVRGGETATVHQQLNRIIQQNQRLFAEVAAIEQSLGELWQQQEQFRRELAAIREQLEPQATVSIIVGPVSEQPQGS